jgi:hypothetical protein
MHRPLQHVKAIRMVHDSHRALPRFVEYAYYAYLFYGMMGSAWGLSVPMLGAGTLVVLAAFCVMRLESRATTVYAPIALPLGCAISFVVLQLTVHGESFMEGYVQNFFTWILALMIVQALALHQGFLHRFALAAFVIGLPGLIYLQVIQNVNWDSLGYERVGLESGHGLYLSNANALASWFGFCAVYFIIVGIETKRGVVRAASWLVAVGCLWVIGITVSRGTLLAVAVATIVASRRLLKRGFLPVLALAILSWIIYISGLFDRVEALYATRGMEETGRLLVWPLVLKRFLNSPLLGVGLTKIGTYVPGSDHEISPHNMFLFLALASGIIPLVFCVAYWWRAAQSALRATERTVDALFCIPLLLYAFLVGQATNVLMESWMTVTLCTALTAGASRRVRYIIVRPMRRGKTAEHTESWSEPGHDMARDQRLVPPASS